MEVVSKRVLLILTALALLGLVADPAVAQCSMCRTALAGSNNSLFIRNFNIGVLVLLVPPVAIFCTMFVALKRHKRQDELADKWLEDKE
jgi:hypothetical protein